MLTIILCACVFLADEPLRLRLADGTVIVIGGPLRSDTINGRQITRPQNEQEQQYSGLFTPEGLRAEFLIDPDTKDIPVEIKAQLNTISGWGRLARTAKSREFQIAATTALQLLIKNHMQDCQCLTNVEKADGRAEAAVLLTNKEAALRQLGLQLLAATGDKTSFKPAIAALKDREPAVRLAAMEVLRRHADESAIPPIMSVARDPKNKWMLEQTIDMLSRIRTTTAKKALNDLRTAHRDAEVTEAVNSALDKIKTLEAAEGQQPSAPPAKALKPVK